MKIYKHSNIKWTDRPPVFLSGMRSLQMLKDEVGSLDITTYRWDEDAAMRWKDVMAGRGEARGFLLRRNESSWLAYDKNGVCLGQSNDVTTTHVAECVTDVSVDRTLLEADARDFLLNEDLSLIACAEYHLGASAADHSNLAVMCRRLIQEADASDLPHLYLVDSYRWPCRVQGFIADLSRLSGKLSDVFIDRVPWLNNSWPLSAPHHIEVFADRLSRVRHDYVRSIIETCCDAHIPDSSEGLQAAWMMAGPGAKYSFAFTLVSLLQEGIFHTPASAEMFKSSALEEHGQRIAAEAKSALGS